MAKEGRKGYTITRPCDESGHACCKEGGGLLEAVRGVGWEGGRRGKISSTFIKFALHEVFQVSFLFLFVINTAVFKV